MGIEDLKRRAAQTREKVMGTLRANPAPFAHDVTPPPAHYLPATPLAPGEDLVMRFRAELERLTGHVHIVSNDEEALDKVLELVGGELRAMAWDDDALALAGLREALASRGVALTTPHARGDGRATTYQDIDAVRVGITGAAAGIATTGSLVMVQGAGRGRLPSLLPMTHIALLRKEKIHARLEDWLPTEGRKALTGGADGQSRASNITFITGPSRTGDIEMEIILGVHGPGVVHVVLW